MSIDAQIIYEDDSLLVVNKPFGLMAHADGKSKEFTLADWVLERYPELAKVGEPWEAQDGTLILRPGIVHRLDKDTSGALVIAKKQEVFEKLKELFKNRAVKKEYRAFVYGGFKEEKKEGVIDKPIGRSPSDFRRFSAQPGARGNLREAQTEYRVLAQTGQSQENDFAYLAVFPKTGRTHQIRVHLKSIHRPIVCDSLYAPKKPCALGFKRLALHAYKISFVLDGQEYVFEAGFPEDFLQGMEALSLNE